MAEINSREALMITIINFFAEKFKNHAVLKGGMALRLLDCPRHTNDIDYTFIPYSSKKDLKPIVISALKDIPGLKVTSEMTSKCLVCAVTLNQISIQIEISAAQDCRSEALSTMELSREHDQQGRIIRIMALDSLLAHKLAAWNERRLIRDLYDVHFLFSTAGARPDTAVLNNRLSNIVSAKGRKRDKASMTLDEFTELLETEAKSLSQEGVESQLRDTLGQVETAGLDKKIRISLNRVIEFLRSPMP